MSSSNYTISLLPGQGSLAIVRTMDEGIVITGERHSCPTCKGTGKLCSVEGSELKAFRVSHGVNVAELARSTRRPGNGKPVTHQFIHNIESGLERCPAWLLAHYQEIPKIDWSHYRASGKHKKCTNPERLRAILVELQKPGATKASAAEALGLSVGTVDYYVRNWMS